MFLALTTQAESTEMKTRSWMRSSICEIWFFGWNSGQVQPAKSERDRVKWRSFRRVAQLLGNIPPLPHNNRDDDEEQKVNDVTIRSRLEDMCRAVNSRAGGWLS